MKITKHLIKQLIKEELARLQEAGQIPAAIVAAGAEALIAKRAGDPRRMTDRLGSGYDSKRLVPPGSHDPQSIQTRYPDVHMRARSEGGYSIDKDDTIHSTHPHLGVDHGEQYEDTFAGDRVIKLPDGTAVTIPLMPGEKTSDPSFKRRVKKYMLMAIRN